MLIEKKRKDKVKVKELFEALRNILKKITLTWQINIINLTNFLSPEVGANTIIGLKDLHLLSVIGWVWIRRNSI